ncbi:MAG: VWA domain-containing protein [bacterium]
MKRSLPILIVFICMAALFTSSCRKAAEKKVSEKSTKPVAEARQSIAAPTLGPPAELPSKPAEKPPEAEPKPEAMTAPRGPITMPAASGVVAESAPPQAAAPAAQVAGLPPQAAGPAPLATLPGTTPPAGGAPAAAAGGAVASLPAPEIQAAPEGTPALAAPEAVQYEPRLVTAQTNIEVILDASGSMGAQFGGSTESKFDIVRKALYDVVLDMGQQQKEFPRNIAVRLFGSKQDASAGDCEDTKLVAPMGEPNLDGIRGALEKSAPKGSSPIAFTLSKSVEDFPIATSADRVVVLVADGSDNCQGDPCAAAAKFQQEKTKTIVHTIAFDIAPDDQPRLECIAKSSDGQFFLARNDAELRSALDQAINSTVPYNLKLTATAGGIPIPFKVTVSKAGTDEVVRRGESLGTKLISLSPGTYDTLIEYAESPEAKKPSKILKGVEVMATTKVEQTIDFDLGKVVLSAQSTEGTLTPAKFRFMKAGTQEQVAFAETGAEAKTFFITPGTYDIAGDLVEAQPESFTVSETGVEVKSGATVELSLKFQKGTLALKGQTTQNESIPFLFQMFKSGTQQVAASGALPAEGGSVMMPPGVYDLMVIGQDPKMTSNPRTRISAVQIKAGETNELTIKFEMGTLTLSAVDGKGNRIPAEFAVREQDSQIEMAHATSSAGAPTVVSVPPGTYEIIASSIKSILEPKPSVPVRDVVVSSQQPVEQVIQFVLGTLRLRGRNAKEQPIRTQFTVYRAGTDEVIAKAPPSGDWMIFDLAPGIYDALATDVTGNDTMRPMIWIRDIKVEDGKTISHEAIFTAGKLKVIGRGPNSKIITCHFKVFKYGTDRELINGVTGDDWEIFEIEPGKYYVEASYHDEEQSVTLKKWINVDIGENEIVELILRF